MSTSIQKLSKSFTRSILTIFLTILFLLIFNKYPKFAESFYYGIVYNSFRTVWDFFLAWNPIPLFYIWLILLVGFGIIGIWNIIFVQEKRIISLKWVFLVLTAHFVWFYWTWGFNYSRIPLGLRWNINTQIQDDLFIKEFYEQTMLVDSIRQFNKLKIERYQIRSDDFENQIRNLVIEFQRKNGFLAFQGVRCRDLGIKGALLIWSTSGVYMPFIAESQIDGGLHKLSKPFTMAHELCHGMGWTHEGDCNFMAYLICKQSNEPFIRYSGELNYWRYLYANASRVHPDHFHKIRAGLSKDLLNDLTEINTANNRFPEIFPALRTWFYDWYLKKHGIASGDNSYSEIIRMVINYKRVADNRGSHK